MKKIYLASGWFNPTQAEELTILENIFDARAEHFDLASPRRIFVCPPGAPKEVQDETFSGNLHHIETSDFLLSYSSEVIDIIKDKFGIILEYEPSILC